MTQILLRADSHPYLADHEIAGTPVVPMALVLEWFARSAAAWSDCPEPLVLRRISVLRKLTLNGFHTDGDRFTVHRQVTGPDLAITLVDGEGIPHYRTTVTTDNTPEPDEIWAVPIGLRPPSRSDTYDGRVLFHGPAFRAIKRVHGISPSGAVGVVTGTAELGWPGCDWRTDPPAVDGGLQLAVLWAEQVIGAATLPMSIREFRVHQPGPLPGPLRCFVRRRRAESLYAECDIGFVGVDGRPRLELTGVSLIVRPDLGGATT
ncbi:hypothetical protein Lesp02_32400 [Lentzea sp. NBRC 105346]|uniref:polyketide synthase dehydratase domain-containing protein n=1 Tax=Lentzea sp. NBRC 105346 TaxID=3032205 RepID=UPI0024A46D90|nr:hypothetical protein Lesp02_32400 [Lentzea sp. NBRC 105346]